MQYDMHVDEGQRITFRSQFSPPPFKIGSPHLAQMVWSSLCRLSWLTKILLPLNSQYSTMPRKFLLFTV